MPFAGTYTLGGKTLEIAKIPGVPEWKKPAIILPAPT